MKTIYKGILCLVGALLIHPTFADTHTTKAKKGQVVQVQSESDITAEAQVKKVLAPYTGIQTMVMNGVANLSGVAPSDTDYEKIVEQTQAVKGITDVNVEKLTVKDSGQPLYDSYLTAKVKGALMQADLMGKDIPSMSLGVETKDGQVFISGTISNEQEREKVLNVIKSVKGVTKVNDKLTIGTNPSTSS